VPHDDDPAITVAGKVCLALPASFDTRIEPTEDGRIAEASAVATFDLVTAVPSSTARRDEANMPRAIVSECAPLAPRFRAAA
jgi:hypothetical protein